MWIKTVEHRLEVFSEPHKSWFQQQNFTFFWKEIFLEKTEAFWVGCQLTEAFFKNFYGAPESILPSYVAWRAGKTTLFLLGS